MNLLKFIRKFSFAKNDSSPNSKTLSKEGSFEKIREMDITNCDKIELLIKEKLNLEDHEISNNSHFYIDLGCDRVDLDELMIDIENIFKIEIQKGAFHLTVGDLKDYVEMKISSPEYFVSQEDLNDDWPLSLEDIFYNEHLMGRSQAIRDLIDNNYQILPKESGNRFKELINFTLKIFESNFTDKPIEADELLRKSFPIMHSYIYRQISIKQNTITGNTQVDEQIAYDEFLIFCKNIFCTRYTDKSVRDEQIRRQFLLLGNDLISFIDLEEKG